MDELEEMFFIEKFIERECGGKLDKQELEERKNPKKKMDRLSFIDYPGTKRLGEGYFIGVDIQED